MVEKKKINSHEFVLKDGKVIAEVSVVPQKNLTSDCWLIQFRGLVACSDCEFFLKKNCGGGPTLLNMIADKILEKYKDLRCVFSIAEQSTIAEAIDKGLSFYETLRYEGGAFRMKPMRLKKVYRQLVEDARREYERAKRVAEGSFVPLDEKFPYFEMLDRAHKIIQRTNWHYPQICDCELETRKGAYRDTILEIKQEDGSIVVLYYYHQHCIMAEYSDRVVLDSCGWMTYTTKERLRLYLPARYSIYQENRVWKIYDRGTGETIEFFDGLELPI